MREINILTAQRDEVLAKIQEIEGTGLDKILKAIK